MLWAGPFSQTCSVRAHLPLCAPMSIYCLCAGAYGGGFRVSGFKTVVSAYRLSSIYLEARNLFFVTFALGICALLDGHGNGLHPAYLK